MKWESPLEEAILQNRYKRFLADIQLKGEALTVHVPNTGAMTSCWAPGWTCAVSKAQNPDRKLPYTLELIHNGETWIGVNTNLANKLAHEWLKAEALPTLAGYKLIQPEKKLDSKTRFDFYLEGHATLPPCYVEVKNVTLKLDGKAAFPDAVSERGQKHLRELITLKKSGLRAVMLYVVAREDVIEFIPAKTIDPRYAELLQEAQESGVEILVVQCRMGLQELGLGKVLPFTLN